jgi:hypothetical protein
VAGVPGARQHRHPRVAGELVAGQRGQPRCLGGLLGCGPGETQGSRAPIRRPPPTPPAAPPAARPDLDPHRRRGPSIQSGGRAVSPSFAGAGARGAFEWLIVVVLLGIAAVLGAVARRDWRVCHNAHF